MIGTIANTATILAGSLVGSRLKMLMCHKETHKRLIDSSLLFRKFCFRTFFFNADML